MLARRVTAPKLEMVGGARAGSGGHLATPPRAGTDGVVRLHCVCGTPLGTTRRQAVTVLAFHRMYATPKPARPAAGRTSAAFASARTVSGSTTS